MMANLLYKKKKGGHSGHLYSCKNSRLISFLRRNGKFLAAVTASCCKYPASVGGSHTLTETVLVDALAY